jgi:hypothetical protein
MTIDRCIDPTCVCSSSLTNCGKQFLKRGPVPLRRRKRAREELEKDALEDMKDTKEEDNTKEVEDEPNILEANGENIEDKDVEQEDVEGMRNADGVYLFKYIPFPKKINN